MDETYLCTINLLPKLLCAESGTRTSADKCIQFNLIYQNTLHKMYLYFEFVDRRRARIGDRHVVWLKSDSLLQAPMSPAFKVALNIQAVYSAPASGMFRSPTLSSRTHRLCFGFQAFTGHLIKDGVVVFNARQSWTQINGLDIEFWSLSPKVLGIARSRLGVSAAPSHRQTLFNQIHEAPDSLKGRFVLICEQEENDEGKGQLFYVHTEVMVDASNVLKTWIQADYNDIVSGRPYKVHCCVEALGELLQLVYLQTVSAQFACHLIAVLTLADYWDMPQVLDACVSEIKHEIHYKPELDRMKELLGAICQLSVEEDELCPMALKALLPHLYTGTTVNQPLLDYVNECFKNKPREKLNAWWLNAVVRRDN